MLFTLTELKYKYLILMTLKKIANVPIMSFLRRLSLVKDANKLFKIYSMRQ